MKTKNFSLGFLTKWSAFYSSLTYNEKIEYAKLTQDAYETVKAKFEESDISQ